MQGRNAQLNMTELSEIRLGMYNTGPKAQHFRQEPQACQSNIRFNFTSISVCGVKFTRVL